MANKKNYYYVLVMTNHGPVFVTGIPERRTAQWDKLEKPMEFSRDYARDVTIGLCVNGHMAYTVCQPYELNNQPYRYELGELEFKEKEEEGGDEE